MNPRLILKSKKGRGVLAIAVFLLVAIPIIAYSFSPKKPTNTKVDVLNAQSNEIKNRITEREAQKLLAKISELMELPKNETPTIATITDRFLLPAQPFYLNAQNGDKVLIYMQTQKAILYRPSKHKIIEVAPISVTSPTPQARKSSSSESVEIQVSPTKKPAATPTRFIRRPRPLLRSNTNTP